MCEWCGHDHPQTALCTKRPTWGRRGFLMLLGSAAIGLAVKDLPLLGSPLTQAVDVDWSAAMSIFAPMAFVLEVEMKDDRCVGTWKHVDGRVVQTMEVKRG